MKNKLTCLTLLVLATLSIQLSGQELSLNEKGYLHTQGLDVTFFSDFYPEGHQSGVTIIMHGSRIAANGDLRLESSPGQWSPTPTGDEVTINKEEQSLSKHLKYPNPDKNRKGFNPIIYPDLEFEYDMSIKALEGNSFLITVDLEKALPEKWLGKVGFNLELFPGALFGNTWILDDKSGFFNPQHSGALILEDTAYIAKVMAAGKKLTIAPEDPSKKIVFESKTNTIQLLDGRANHNNGWFIMKVSVPEGATEGAIQIKVTPSVIPAWKYKPVIQVSQLGYHPSQSKKAIIELDRTEINIEGFKILKKNAEGTETVLEGNPENWGSFLRYKYFVVDFSSIQENGIYQVQYGDQLSHAFQISPDVFKENTWQSTLEYYLPVQMCHMRINEKYRVWHDLCHMDDALMAPTDTIHVDGYRQGSSTMTKFQPHEHVPGLNQGGWHDAGDYDLRVESQAGTIKMLAWMVEEFGLEWDATLIDQEKNLVEIHQPDGKSDVLQQIEHGLLSILGPYRSLGRLCRGIIAQDLRQYVMLGDAASMTDNLAFDAQLSEGEKTGTHSSVNDDRWVFTEDNPNREIQVIPALAVSSRVLNEYNPELARESLDLALTLWENSRERNVRPALRIAALCELYLSTGENSFMEEILSREEEIIQNISQSGPALARVIDKIEDKRFKKNIAQAVQNYQEKLAQDQEKDSPYGVPYKPNIWGAGWTIQKFGVDQYLFFKGWPELTSSAYFENALHFILGVHPGENNSSFVSGVGSNSVTVAYGVNRADWSFIPGGVASGTALIRPDLPEMKVWPFFWQQTEYVMGGGATNFMFLVLAVDQLYN